MLATYLHRINWKISEIVYNIMKLINEKLEGDTDAFWNMFGWGVIVLAIKTNTKSESLK